MKIGFDAKRAFYNNSGLGNYSRTLLKNLTNYYADNEYHLYSPGMPESSFSNFVKEQRNIKVHTPQHFISKSFPSLWRSTGISSQLEQNGIGIYHGLSNELPLNISGKKIKKVVSIHDLIFLRYPELYPRMDRTIYNYKFKKACEDADVIVAISKQTKQDLIEFYGVNEQKIKLIYQSCNELFYRETDNNQIKNTQEKYKLPLE